ncbi:MAG: hypothetical protein IPP02_03885 [Chitinophagaceae bacterium]|nr:hypothetical protein [Chitinophagaceae bacterium]
MLPKHSARMVLKDWLLNNSRTLLENQITTNIIAALKEEEWLLESVGLSTLRSNQLLPTIGQHVKVKDVLDAFLRFDDKPMITGSDAVTKSLLKYCYNGEFLYCNRRRYKFYQILFTGKRSFF